VSKVLLSDAALRSLQPPQKGQIDVWDTSLKGFGCRISQGGSKTFILKLDNSRRTIGRYPIISLAKAREQAKVLLAERTLGKLRPNRTGCQEALDLFLQDKARARRPATHDSYTRQLAKLALKGQLADITPQHAVRQLSNITHPSAYDHTLVAAKVFFNWCIKRHYTTHNPFAGLSPHKSTARTRVLTDADVKLIWQASDSEDLPAPFRSIVKLLILTAQRRGEIAALQSSWISDNSITIPGEIAKNHREHTFPIGKLTVSILPAQSTETTSELLFPARGKPHTPFNGWSKSKALLDKLSGVTDWTLHENKARYLDEMRAAVDLWEKRLSEIIKTDNIPHSTG
jgi:hypothetical protein